MKSLARLIGCVLAFFGPLAAHALEVDFERDRSLPLVYVNVVTRGGAVSDPEGKSGLTNFMGEMLLRGTQAHTKEALNLAFDQIGARIEVDTRTEAMIFRGAVLANKLPAFLDLINEVLTTPTFPEGEITRFKSEVSSGILEELGNDPALGNRWFNRFLFANHPYGKPVLGTLKDVAGFTHADLVRQYNRLIRDQYLMVIGTGDADPAQINAWGKSLAASRPDKLSQEDLPKIDTPKDASARRLLIVDKPDRTQTQINAGQVGVRMTDSDYFPLYLGNYAFGGGSFSARLMVEIRVKRGWSYGANSYFRQGTRPKSWQMYLFPAAKDTPPALATSLQMVQDLKDKGITQPEFDFAQRSLVNSAGFMFNTPKKRVENRILEKTLDLPEGFMKSYGPLLASVSLKQVNDSLKRFLEPGKLAIVVVGTAKDLKAPLAKAAGVAEDQVEVVPYTAE